MAMLKIEHLMKKYPNSDVYAVDDLSLEIEEGEMFGFLGLNGAGKSTTIKCVTGVYPYDSGTIIVNGYDVLKNPLEAKKSLSYVADNHRVYEKLTAREFIDHTANVYKVSMEDRVALTDKLAKKFRLESALDKQVRGFSHGMKQKLCILTALIHSPKLWILDEPLMGLDPQSCIDIIDEMKAHCAKGNCVFFSSHNIDMVARICDRVAIIHNGVLRDVINLHEEGKRDELEGIFLGYTGGVKEVL